MPEPEQHSEDPARSDDKLRRFGRRNYIAGTGILIAAFVITQTAAIITPDRDLYGGENGQLLAVLAFVALAGLGAILIGVGATQTITAHARRDIRQTRDDVEANRELIDGMAGEVRDLAALVHANIVTTRPVVEHLPERIAGLEDAMGAVAQQLPDVLRTSNWQGYNAALRKIFTDQQTGTDGAARQHPHLGLVRNDEEDAED